jgi:hypothetical protein
MGQKVSPVSFRLSKSKDWDFEWISLKKDYSSNLILNLELQEYFKILLKIRSFRFFKFFLKQYANNIYIHVYYCNDFFFKKKYFIKKFKKILVLKNFLKSLIKSFIVILKIIGIIFINII